MELFEETLIREVYLRPCLYDKLPPNKKKRTIIAAAWREISEKCKKSVDECKKKWTGLRDTFNRKNKKPPSGSGNDEDEEEKWTWFQQLSFLKEVNIPMATEDNYESHSIPNENVVPKGSVDVEVAVFNENEVLEAQGNEISDTVNYCQAKSEGKTSPTIISGMKRPKLVTCPTATPSSSLYNKNFKKPRDNMAYQWTKVIDKLTDAADSSVTNSDSSSLLFGKYFASELDKMNEMEQDTIKFAVFGAIKSVKKARLE